MEKKMKNNTIAVLIGYFILSACSPAQTQIGTRFPSERKVVTDPVTGTELIFLTSTPAGDSKIYPTHNQWTSDGEWVIFRSRRVRGEAMAVNESTGDIVQVTEGGYRGMLNVARKSMKLYYMRRPQDDEESRKIIEVDLAKLFADSKAGTLKSESEYQKIIGTIPTEFGAIFKPEKLNTLFPCHFRSVMCKAIPGFPVKSFSVGKPAANPLNALGLLIPTAPDSGRFTLNQNMSGSLTKQ